MTAKRIAVITPGGDASGINACLRAIVREAIYNGFEVFGIYKGYQGLVDGDIRQLNARSVGNIIHRGGTILRSTRCALIKTPQGIEKAAEQLKRHRIDYLIVVGGDGSLNAALRLSKKGISVIGIPASIDNDVYGTTETIGFDTAVDVAIEAIDKIRDTASSFDRIFIVEVMGRGHGFLATAIGLASGAEYILAPEFKFDLNKICAQLKKDKKKGKASGIIVSAEGIGDVFKIAKAIEKSTGISTRASVLGYIQRGGAPSARSRNIGIAFGSYAIGLIKKGLKNRLVVLKVNDISHIPLQDVRRRKKMDPRVYLLAQRLAI